MSWCSTTSLLVDVAGRSGICEDLPGLRSEVSILASSHGWILSELLQKKMVFLSSEWPSERRVVALLIRHMVARASFALRRRCAATLLWSRYPGKPAGGSDAEAQLCRWYILYSRWRRCSRRESFALKLERRMNKDVKRFESSKSSAKKRSRVCCSKMSQTKYAPRGSGTSPRCFS